MDGSPHGQLSDAYRPVVMGRNGMVCSGHPLASEAGVAILRSGGNAVDAAISVAAALGVVEPQSSGIGGDGFIMVHAASAAGGEPEERTRVINASGPAPRAATRDAYSSGIPMNGIRSVSIPGLVDGWLEAHGRYGRLSLTSCLEPAISLAREGFPITHKLAAAILEDPLVMAYPSSSAVFGPNGRPLRPGEILRQPDLANTLELIGAEGRAAFYEGSIAQRLVELSDRLGGLLQLDDFSGFRAQWQEPISTDYRGYLVLESPANTSGHVLLQELNIVETLDVASLPRSSAEAIHLMVEAKRLAFADREAHVADPDWVEVPMEGLISKAYAVDRARYVDRDQAMESVPAGDPWKYANRAPSSELEHHGPKGERTEDTTCLAVVDHAGNAVCQLQSVQSVMGSAIVADGTGILLNNRMTYWHMDEAHIDRLEPGKRVRHTMNTVMVFQNGNLILVHGTPGADTQVQTNLQVLTHVLDHGLTVTEAVEAPRWRHIGRGTESTIPYGEEDALELEARFPDEVFEGLRRRGHPVVRIGPWDAVGSEVAIKIDHVNGALHGACDPRRDGYAIGY
jgi:gamma-glutamyltranspeptidase/glutathione hydrolase